MNLSKFNLGTIAIIVLLFFGILQFNKCSSDREKDKLKAELHAQLLRGDTLKKISDTQYEKLVADTLTKKRLKQIIDSLGIIVKNPLVVTKIVYQQKTVEKDVDGIVVKDSIVSVEDYYPNKEKQTIKYTSKINLKTTKGTSKFEFQPQTMDLVVSQEANGLWKATFRTDSEFVNINSVDVLALPSVTKEIVVNNWGTLGGVKYNTSMTNKGSSLEVLGGVRYKKVNIIGSASTNKELGVGLIIEF